MSDTATKGGFDALLEEIGGLAKAMPPADESGEGKVEAAAEEAEDGDGDGDEDGEKKPFAKSYVLKGEDGEEVEAIDGTELVKSLIERLEGNEEKTLAGLRGLVEMVKSLQAEVTMFRGSAKPRKTVLTVAERPAAKAEEMAKSHAADGMTVDDFMTKSMVALAAGKITSRDVALAEQLINSGKQPPEHVRRAVLS